MDVISKGPVGKIILIYIDDLIIFSKTSNDYISHLKMVFQSTDKYNLSLNPKKYMFASRSSNY